jgi:CPA2 family monovalent cation:H+ antiporter-2
VLAVLTPLGAGAALNAVALEWTGLRLGIFLLAMVGGGSLVIPPLVRFVARMGRDETLVVASIGICFGFAMEAERAGYSVALGAFLAGSLVAESGMAECLEELIRPLRDVFAAVFFVSVGMMIDPTLIVAHWPALAPADRSARWSRGARRTPWPACSASMTDGSSGSTPAAPLPMAARALLPQPSF